MNFIRCDANKLNEVLFDKLPTNIVMLLYSNNTHAMPSIRRAIIELFEKDIKLPIIIERDYANSNNEDFQLYASTDAGGLLLDGMGDGLFLRANGSASPQMINSLAFGILQAARTRISKTEYISCPSCGRTLFDLQETTAKIRSRTSHLKGIKIGIMGCIVNGPGEMADADYGYVGSGVGKITLYKGKEVVTKSIQAERAVDALINLIKQHGDWVEPVLE
jgi:(E)-4-hydroxy-3-methylbut-2-enyl-diphosphate synthase